MSLDSDFKGSFGVNRLDSSGELALTSFPQANWEKRSIPVLQSDRPQFLSLFSESRDVFNRQCSRSFPPSGSIKPFNAKFSGEKNEVVSDFLVKEPEKKAKNRLGFFFGLL